MPPSKKDAGRTCRECGRRRATHPRVMCRICYMVPALRVRHPSRSPRIEAGLRSRGERPPPAEPTEHLPGTEGKIAVMRHRDARGEQLYHPADATYDGRVAGAKEVSAGGTIPAARGEEDDEE